MRTETAAETLEIVEATIEAARARELAVAA
jgi:hypothetical protein